MSDSKPTRKRRLKVYAGNYDGRRTVVMACYSFREFQKATRVSRDYGCETGNTEDVRQALSEPGVRFVRPITAAPGTPWERLS